MEIKIDYFSTTFPLDLSAEESTLFKVYETVKIIATYLNVQNFEIIKIKYAQNNFNYQYQLGEHITLRLDGPMNENYHKTCQLEMKGEGCRDFESRNPDKTWKDLILFMAEQNAKFKRIDLAIDDYEGKNITLEYLYPKILKKHYSSIFKSEAQPHGTLESGLTLQFGSHNSLTQLVIYDKQKEQQKRKKFCDKDYWTRYEMRFRNELADSIAYALCKTTSLQQYAYSQLYRIIDIKEDNHYDVRSQYQISTDPHWQSFLQNVEKGKLEPTTHEEPKFFSTYMQAANSYISMWFIVHYLQVLKDPYLFEMEIYKFISTSLTFSKKRFQRLNIFLNQMNLTPLDNTGLAQIKQEFQKLLEEKELPF